MVERPEPPTSPLSDAPPQRVLLLGASNLTKGLATAVAASNRLMGPGLELFVAHGHGRSFGRPTSLFGRELPGILQCRLWQEIDRPGHPAAPYALVTDIGNDLLYESPLETIAAWIEDCLDRLADHQARTVVTELPICNFPRLSERRFRLFRKLFFPRCSLSRLEILRRGEKLNERVKNLASARNFFLVAPRPEWYGVDPIHVRRGMRERVWQDILSAWSPSAPRSIAQRPSAASWIYLRSRRPAHYRRFGAERRRRQPSGRLAGGGTLSVY